MLSSLQAAWLGRTSKENIRRWFPRAGGGDEEAYIDYEALEDRLRGTKHGPPLHPAWLWITSQTLLPPDVRESARRAGMAMPDETDTDSLEARLAELRGRLAVLEMERDAARADAQAADLAAMSYRDNWLRATQPASPKPLTSS